MMLEQDINQNIKIGFKKIRLYIHKTVSVAILFLATSNVSAGDACQVFLNGVQAHGSSGSVEFKYDAQLRSGATSVLAAKTVKNTNSSSKKSCESVWCTAAGNASAKFSNITFKNSSSNTNVNVPWNGNLTLGADGISQYGKVSLASSSTVNFSSQVTTYKLKELSLAYNAVANMPAGDYWIEKLKISSSSYIRVQGTGTVRLFVKEDLDLGSSASFNENTTDASKLILYAYGKTSLSSYAKIYGLVYALGEGKLAYAATINGAVSASKIQLDTDSFVLYQSAAAGGANFGEICQQGDLVPPVLTINTLPAETENSQVTVTGTVSDPVQAGSGIASVVVKLTDGSQVSAIVSGSNYSAAISLVLGTNNFVVEAKDLSNNSATVNGSVKRVSYPELTIISPQNNSVVFQPVISVQGEVKTAWPVSQINVLVNNQAQTLQTISADVFQFTAANLPLALGSNQIQVRAITPDGFREQILTVIYALLDSDLDGYPDDVDAFPFDPSEWSDMDSDGMGDNSDPDRDGDGFNNLDDAFPNNPAEWADLDADGIGDNSDPDRDGDGHNNDVDKFPNDASEWADLDNDGIGDNADTDRDGDGYSNDQEIALGTDPNDPNSKPSDLDNDGIPDALDDDRDGDGHNNDVDSFPNDATEWSDLDSDGIGDNKDTDRDGDGYSNDLEIAEGSDPNNAASKPQDIDNDGIPDSTDPDRDGDGYNNDVDKFPNDASEWSDLDNDGIGDNADTDRDGDGYSNDQEIALGTDPNDPNSKPDDLDNDGIPDALDDDRDGDGHNNDVDSFPNDATEWSDLDSDGIGDNKDTDRDGDGYSNDLEIAEGSDPNNAASKPQDIDNDGIPDSTDPDRDGDGHNNDVDKFPNDASEWADLDNDGIGDNSDTDRDGDGYSNDQEIALGTDPNDPNSKPSDLDNDGIPDALDDDRDGDGRNNDVDSFPNDATEWSDLDSDGIGDNKDTDRDGDGYSNDVEIAEGSDPNNAASKPQDIDNDGIPDSTDPDRDGDGHNNDVDKFPNDASEWADLDNDGIGDNSDPDRDGDGYSNDQEIALGTDPNDPNSKPDDLDNDGIPDSLDDDRDGDGHNNDVDSFPDDSTEWFDLDNDGIGDNSDPDRDGDGYSNDQEIALGTNPNDPNSKPTDLDNDGIPDSLDTDRDGDGYNNDLDKFPDDITEWSDLDLDGIGDNKDTDRDGDGFDNLTEEQKNTDPNNAADYPDVVAPVIGLLNTPNEQVNTASVLIRFNVSDAIQPHSGIASIKLTNDQYPNVVIDAVAMNNLVEQSIPLAIGVNSITIIATDASGNSAQVVHQVTRLAKANFVQISPADGSVVNTSTITISGQIESSRNSNEIRFYINEWQVTPDASGTLGLYQFSLPNVSLNLGQNIFLLRLETPDGADERTLTVQYQPEDPDSIAAPELTLVSPLSGAQLNSSSFLLKGRVISHAGNVNLQINNQPVSVSSASADTYYFESLLSFANGSSSLSVNISATDALNKTTTLNAVYFYDSQIPQIQLIGLTPSPTINAILQSPTQISGTISDFNLASVTLNNQPISLEATAQPGSYKFTLPLSLQPGEQTAWVFTAADLSGNQTSVEYLFQSGAQTAIAALLPIENASFLSNGQPLNVQVAARLTSIAADNSVRVVVNNQITPLTVAGTLASGNVTVPAQTGSYALQYQVVNAANEVVVSTVRQITVKNEEDIPVELVSYQPENGASNIEPNQPLEFYFNKQVDLAKLQLVVRETLHGSTYINLDESGMDFLSAKGYQLADVHRDNEVVSGSLSLLPGNQAVAFYPARQFGFNANIFVDLVYDGKSLARSNFTVRRLPTFIMGGVVDQFGQPLAGIKITLPEINRSAVTNGDGAFAFGFQEPAGQEIPGGQYRLVINADLQNPRFGMRIHKINVQAERKNEIGVYRTTELHPNAPFQIISSGQSETSFVSDELRLDLTNARILFPTSSGVRTSGSIQFQFMPFDQLGIATTPGAIPMWMYAAQPQGVETEGEISINIKMPKLSGSYDYLSLFDTLPGDDFVVLLGFDSDREILSPIGVGKIENYRVISQGSVSVKSLDYIGYAIVKPELQTLLKQIAEGQSSLQDLLIELQK